MTALLLLATALVAAPETALTPEEILGRVEARYRELSSLELAFTESHENRATGRTLSESGRLLAARPRRMRWEYTAPEEKLFVLSDDLAWFWVPEEEVAYRMHLADRDSRRLPTLFLTGEARLQDDYTAQRHADDGSLELIPRSGSDEYDRLLLSVEPETFRVTALRVIDALGNVTRFEFSGESHDVVVPEGAFRFEPPPGAEIVDRE